MGQRYEREIDEILEQAGNIGSRSGNKGLFSLVWTYCAQSIGGPVKSLRPGRVMLIAVAILILALFLNASMPGMNIVAPIAVTGLILFIVAYAMFFIRPPNKSNPEKRWRGQPIDDDRPSLWDKMRNRG